jgi:hypothetical protein
VRCSDVSPGGDPTDQAHGIAYPTSVRNVLSRHDLRSLCAVIVPLVHSLQPCQRPASSRLRGPNQRR